MSLVEVEDEDTSTSSSEQSDDGGVNHENPPLPKTRKRSRDKIVSSKVDEEHPQSKKSRDPYEQLHRQMITAADQLKKLQERCELLYYMHHF